MFLLPMFMVCMITAYSPTVEELIEELKQKPSNSKVCIRLNCNTYDVGKITTLLGGIVTVQGCNWVLVNNDVVIVCK